MKHLANVFSHLSPFIALQAKNSDTSFENLVQYCIGMNNIKPF